MASTKLPEFDDAVVRAMAKWPDVPECFGWLRLDRRGYWRIQNEVIAHARAVAFLGRHYRADERGRWYVQNGPQRVFVELDYAPWIFRFDQHNGFSSHTGIAIDDIRTVLTDDDGNLLVEAEIGLALVDDRDLSGLVDLIVEDSPALSTLRWRNSNFPLQKIARAEVPSRFGFVMHPEPA